MWPSTAAVPHSRSRPIIEPASRGIGKKMLADFLSAWRLYRPIYWLVVIAVRVALANPTTAGEPYNEQRLTKFAVETICY